MSASVLLIGAAMQARGSRSDGERVALLRADRELRSLAVIVSHAELSDIALARALRAVQTIASALDAMRPVLGLAPRRPPP